MPDYDGYDGEIAMYAKLLVSDAGDRREDERFDKGEKFDSIVLPREKHQTETIAN
jgi:hypothetical protein